MAITVALRPNSGAWGTDTGTLLFLVTGTSDELAAKAALAASPLAPVSRGGLVRSAVNVEPIGDPAVTEQWDGVVRYRQAAAARQDIGTVSISFQIGGGTQHLTQARKHIAGYPCPPCTEVPDFGGAIGVSMDGGGLHVEGVDVESKSFEFAVTKVFAQGSYPSLANLYALKNTYNNAQFSVTDSRTGLTITLAAGECRFRGATGGPARSDDGLEITYQFAAEPNVNDFCAEWPASSKPTAAVPKKGWEYAWVAYGDAADGTAKRLVKRPLGVFIEQVCDPAAWAGLGL